jgi:hypothetical protein
VLGISIATVTSARMTKGGPMTEAEWLACGDPLPMLESLRGTNADRKLRLFAVACCQRLIQTVHLHPWYAHGIEVAERFADGKATPDELERVRHYPSPDWCLQYAPQFNYDEITAGGQPIRVTKLAINACWNAMEPENGVVLADCAATNAAWAATVPGAVMPDDGGASAARLAAEQVIQCNILRDIFSNPFRPVTVDPVWLTSTVTAMARQIYEFRDFSAMPILADALEEAGCANEVILNHCRRPGPHVRGCWVIDLVLGKESSATFGLRSVSSTTGARRGDPSGGRPTHPQAFERVT